MTPDPGDLCRESPPPPPASFARSPGAAGRGRVAAEAEAQTLQLLHVAAQPVVEHAGQEAARGPARRHACRAQAAEPRLEERGRGYPGLPVPGTRAPGSFDSEVLACGACE